MGQMRGFRAWLVAAAWIVCTSSMAAECDRCAGQQPCAACPPRCGIVAMLMPGRLHAPTPSPSDRNQSIYGTPAYAWGYFGAAHATPATQQRDYYYTWVEWTFRHGD